MTNEILILNKLKEISPQGMCDDCLAELLGVNLRQQVNQICNLLTRQNKIDRRKAECKQHCEKTSRQKFVNFEIGRTQ